MRLSKQTTNIWASISLLIMLLAACTPLVTPQPTPTTEHTLSDSELTNIRVSQIEPEKTNTNTENIELPNCGGTSELSQSLGAQVSIQKNVTVAATVITRAGVEAKIPLTARAKLEAEIELAYEQSYTTVASRLDTIQTKAERESHVVYVIQWEEQKFVSTVSFVNNGDDYEVPYTYVLRVPKLKDSYRTPCPTSTAIITITNTVTPTATSTDTPTFTSTPIPQPSDTSPAIPVGTSMPTLTTVPNHTSTAAAIQTAIQQAVSATLTAAANMVTPTETPIPTATNTSLPTTTHTRLPTVTLTDTPVPPTDTVVPPTPTPMPPTNTPIQPTPTFTPEPVKLSFVVQGKTEDGVRIDIETAGTYQLEYIGNAYSPWSTDASEGNRGWATHIQVFINRPVEWGRTEYGLIGPINFDAYLGASGYYMAKDAVVVATQGRSAYLGRLNEGDYISFVIVDERGRYTDNRGQVDLTLVRISQ